MNNETYSIFARRLKSAREMRNMSMAALSASIGNKVSPQAIYKYEAGKMLPGSALLIELSKALKLSVDYFFRPFDVTVSGIEFRKKCKLKVGERKTIEGETLDRVEKYVEIEDICGIRDSAPDFLKSRIRKEADVVALVDAIRAKWKLGDRPIDNVINLLEDHGVIVIEIDAPDTFDGLSGMANEIPVIVLNKKFPSPERKRFTALHELGHLVMSFEEEMDDKRIENCCNLFANEMLLPRSVFEQEMGEVTLRILTLQQLALIQHKYGISIDAIMYKAKECGMISDSKHKYYHILKHTKPYFKQFADKSRTQDENAERFENLVYQALSGDLISLSKAAGFLGLPPDEVMAHSKTI